MPVKPPYILQHAMDVIQKEYGDTVSIDLKDKDLLKFGRNKLVATTGSTLMTLPSGTPHETYVSDNLITTVSSSNNSDTVEVALEGFTISGGIFTFVEQTITLTGQTQATLTTPLARATRAYNNNGTDLLGSVYFYEDGTSSTGVPDIDSEIHLIIDIGENQTDKASATLADNEYWIVTSFSASVLEKIASFAHVSLEIRKAGKVFRTVDTISASSSAAVSRQPFNPYIIVPRNADIRLVAESDAINTDMSGSIQGYLAELI